MNATDIAQIIDDYVSFNQQGDIDRSDLKSKIVNQEDVFYRLKQDDKPDE